MYQPFPYEWPEYYTEQEYLDLMSEALSIFDEPDFVYEPDDEPTENVCWAN